MIRKLLNRLLPLCIAIMLAPVAGAAPASEGLLNVDCDDELRTVTITGVIPSRHTDRKIMLFVVKPEKTMDGAETLTEDIVAYAAQTITDADGYFEFSFILDKEAKGGNYFVKAGAALSDEVLTDSFYFVTEDLVREVIEKVNKALSASELEVYIKITYLSCIKVNLEGDFSTLASQIDVFEKMSKKNNYTSLHEIREEFNLAVAEQKQKEYKEKIINEINNANADAMGNKLLQYNDELNLPLTGDTNSFAMDYNKKDSFEQYENQGFVHGILEQTVFPKENGIAVIRKVFYEALTAALINHLEQGENFAFGDISTRYSPYISLPDEYLSYSDKIEIHKLVIGRHYNNFELLVQALKDAILTLAKENTGNQSSGSSPNATKISGGSGGTISPQISAPTPIPSTESTFYDLENVPWAQESIERLAEAGILQGVSGTEFAPNLFVTREQFVTMLLRTFNLEEQTDICGFLDVEKDSWYYNYVVTAQKLGIVQGIDTEYFGVGEEITRQDMAVLAYRLVNHTNIQLKNNLTERKFTDADEIASYAEAAITAMNKSGIISGHDDGRFAPLQYATRAEAAKIIYQLFALI